MAKKPTTRTDENSAAVLVRMPPKMAEELSSAARREDLNREQLIRRILREWVDRKP